ncbi:MAG: hypothetical protein JWQ98_160 [Chlorobi bacterium]|nr:hypothetical protein [Chlorobiota bacterium]
MIRFRIPPLIPLMMFLTGCSTMHHFVPPVPPEPGHGMVAIGLTWAPHYIYPITVQADAYVALGRNDIIGAGFCNFFFPNNISYVHYQRIDDANRVTYQLHVNHIFFDSFDPAYEASVGLGFDHGSFQGTGKLGVAWFGHGIFPLNGWNFGSHSSFTPVAGCDLWYGHPGLSAEVYPGMTSHFVDSWRNVAEPPVPGVIDSLKVIEGIVSDREIDAGWKFTLADGTMYELVVARARMWIEGIQFTGITTGNLQQFASRHALPLWSLRRLDTVERREQPRLFHIDYREVMKEYRSTGRLVLRDTPTTIDPIRWGLDDLTFGLGFHPILQEP